MSIAIDNLVFRYEDDRFELRVGDLSIDADQPAAIIGPSGSGKTTLLRLMAGMLKPGGGSVRVLGKNVSAMSDKRARAFRMQNIGLVFQEFELLAYLNARDNILLPFRLSGLLTLDKAARQRVDELAQATGIAHLLDTRPAQLSQGERQRVAICRALITRPRFVLVDEPTGSLDPDNQKRIVELLHHTAAAAGAGLVMVTHDHNLLGYFDRVIDLPSVKSQQEARV